MIWTKNPEVLQFVADGVAAADMGEALRLAAGRGSASVVRELVAVGAHAVVSWW